MSDSANDRDETARRPMSVADIQAALSPWNAGDPAGDHVLAALARCRENIDTDGDVLDDALRGGGPWSLRSITVSGFRGAANGSDARGAAPEPLSIELPRTADVVVAHAANGAGKSTISDALGVALAGGIEAVSTFTPTDIRRPTALHLGATRAHVAVVFDNAEDDQLRLSWRLHGNDEQVEVAWCARDDPHGVVEQPGDKWADAIAAHHPVVGYDHLTHRLRVGHLADYVREMLNLGPVWRELWDELDNDLQQSVRALDRWRATRTNVVDAIDDLDRDFVVDHPYLIRPEPLVIPASPSEDVQAWFIEEFSEAEPASSVPPSIDPDLSEAIGEALAQVGSALARYREIRSHGERALWSGDGLSALADLLERTEDRDLAHCPTCGADEPNWRENARRTLSTLEMVHEEFNLAQASMTELADLLVERLLPLLIWAEAMPASAEMASRLRTSLEPLVGERPRIDQDKAWCALEAVIRDEAFEPNVNQMLATLTAATDHAGRLRSARKDIGRRLVDAHTAFGRLATQVDDLRAALARVASVYDRIRGERRDAIQEQVNGPLRTLLADTGFGDISLEVDESDVRHLDDSLNLRLSLEGANATVGTLSAGQYNALVLALLLATDDDSPFRVLVVDDPVHAFDDFRSDAFAQLIAQRASRGRQTVVLTHDQQLVDVMRDHIAHLFVLKFVRDQNGNIGSLDMSHPWRTFAADARSILHRNTRKGSPGVLSDTTTKLLVLALCRQALDAAAREFVLYTSPGAQSTRDVRLNRLRNVHTTRNLLRLAREFVTTGHPVDALITDVLQQAGYLNDLNAAAHGDVDRLTLSFQELTARVDLTERYCVGLSA